MDNMDNEKVGKKIRQAMEDNSQDSPALSIDPETNKPAIVGNPNNLPSNKGEYDITFMYPEDMVAENEKANMKLDKTTGYYVTKVHYTNKRIKPLYRGSILVHLTSVFASTGILKEEGYKLNLSAYALGEAFQKHIRDVAEIAKEVLSIPEDQIEYIAPNSLIDFLTKLLENEPNILNECYNFLA